MNKMRPDHNTRSSMPYSLQTLQIVYGFFDVPLGYVNSQGLWDRAYSL